MHIVGHLRSRAVSFVYQIFLLKNFLRNGGRLVICTVLATVSCFEDDVGDNYRVLVTNSW